MCFTDGSVRFEIKIYETTVGAVLWILLPIWRIFRPFNCRICVSDALPIRSVSPLEESSTDRCVSNSILLRLSESEVFPSGKDRLVMAEAYVLAVKPDKKCISITGSTSAGIFYGVVSLVSLLQGLITNCVHNSTAVVHLWSEKSSTCSCF